MDIDKNRNRLLNNLVGKRKKQIKILITFVSVLLLTTIFVFSIFFINPSWKSSKISYEAKKLKNECSENIKWNNCYLNGFKKLTKKYTLNEVVLILKDIQKQDPKTFSCHGYAHIISRGETDKKSSDWVEVARSIDLQSCANGYFHGMLESLLYSKKIAFAPDSINNLCHKRLVVNEHREDLIESCYHAVGHIALLENSGNVEEAIRFCNNFSPYSDASYCYRGLFMEEFEREGLVSHGIKPPLSYKWDSIKKEEQLCHSYKGSIATACWKLAATMYMYADFFDPKKVFNSCRRSGTDSNQVECYTYAVYVTMLTPFFNGKLDTLCQPYFLDENNYKYCLERQVQGLADNKKNILKVQILCNTLSGERKKYCKFLKMYNFAVRPDPGKSI